LRIGCHHNETSVAQAGNVTSLFWYAGMYEQKILSGEGGQKQLASPTGRNMRKHYWAVTNSHSFSANCSKTMGKGAN